MRTLKESIMYIIICILIAIAAFEGGIIYQSKNIEISQRKLTKMEAQLTQMAGEIESHKAIFRGIKKGRMPEIP